ERHPRPQRLPLPRRRARHHHQGRARFPLLLEHRHRLGHVPRDGRRRHPARRSRHAGMPHPQPQRQTSHPQRHAERRRRGPPVKPPVKPIVALIGGFLGAGKTTLILAAAELIQRRGANVAVVLNDQGDDLVDTLLVQSHCVPEVIFAEAVGSCTDIVATTLRPLLRDYAGRFRVAPLTVVLHPAAPFTDPDLQFLSANQQAEADVLVGRASSLPPGARHVDAVTGEGVAEWLEEILAGTLPVAANALTLDYARYAAAEAS